ncbi:hypothetical protein GCM10010918_14400 [Paenibacillus radicis (ex Gao et al. 2016)]|uniref:Uncharacterized protein n=1 Tax=Paenibacillus radicis (ex Gao et al. 2016) TaxID=1737354 RepID=A0A917GYT7_9BACL|nr:hypothetical protein GCM10010918_14400 [Paenibacillus radicis (ex Gao et al. 2016)]
MLLPDGANQISLLMNLGSRIAKFGPLWVGARLVPPERANLNSQISESASLEHVMPKNGLLWFMAEHTTIIRSMHASECQKKP